MAVMILSAILWFFAFRYSQNTSNLATISWSSLIQPPQPPPVQTESPPQSSIINDQLSVYTHPHLKFSFNYPSDFTLATFQEDEENESVLVQKAAEKQGFEIVIQNNTTGNTLTIEQIKKETPETVVDDPQTVIIGQEKNIPAIIFWGQHPSLGRTREMRFIHGSKEYRISAYAESDTLVGRMLQTWKFN